MPKISTKSIISDKYQVVIPKAVRDCLGLHVGQEVIMHPLEEQGAVLMMPKTKTSKPWYEKMSGLGQGTWAGIDPVEYVRALRNGWENKASGK